ncbi:MAG: O-antigen ligase family protein [bacterium]|nr:O-antigen ligase family protein [bacterium]
MNLTRLLYRIDRLNPAVEFFIILAWALFYPAKDSHIFFLGFAALISLSALRNISFMKNLSLSYFSYFLGAFNLILIISIFSSNYLFKSLLQLTDILLVSIYFLLFYFDKQNEDVYFIWTAYLLSLSSFLFALNYLLRGDKTLFFSNSIFQGIASGIGCLVLLYYLLKGRQTLYLLLLPLNIVSLYLSQSKAAFIGCVAISLLMIVGKMSAGGKLSGKSGKLLIAGVCALVLLTFIVPNPIKDIFRHSLKKDRYSGNRIDIWNMTLTIFKDAPLTGVGLDNFSEVSGKYNFKQENKDANYFKVPQHTHNDYLKILCETGIGGLLFILCFFAAFSRKLRETPLFNLPKMLLFYLLFQALLFNLVFHIFFFILLLYLLKSFFESQPEPSSRIPTGDAKVPVVSHSAFSILSKSVYVFLLLFIFVIGYLLPYLSYNLVQKARKETDIMQRHDLLKKSRFLNPLDRQTYYLEGLALFNYFKQTGNLEAFNGALQAVKECRRLNKYFSGAYVLESELYSHMPSIYITYPGLESEITAPLEKAEEYAPLDPFIKLRKAGVYLRFNQREAARREALAAIRLEPNFVSALHFLQDNFHHFPDESAFKIRVTRLSQRALQLRDTNSYLYHLFKEPENREHTREGEL